MGQSDNDIHFIQNSINNYFSNINSNINSSSINNNYNNILQISKSPLVDSVSEAEVNSVGIYSSMPKADQLDCLEGDLDFKLGTKRKQVKELTIRNRLYKRRCHNAYNVLQTGDISAAYPGDSAAAIALSNTEPQVQEGLCSHKGDEWDLSGERCSVPRPKGPILSDNTSQSNNTRY